MRIKRSLRSGITAGLTVLAVVALGACGGKSKKSSNPDAPPAAGGGGGGGGGETPADNDLALSGSLNILGSSASTALALAGDSYDVYCVTFEDDPAACKAAIDGEGNFNETCEDYAGKAFGCFLRKNNKTVGDIVFDQGGTSDEESQLVAGAGTIKISLNFDPELGVATAVVDTTASTALAADKVAAAKGAANLSETTVPTLTGKYALELLGRLDDEGKVVAASADAEAGGGQGGEGGKGGIPPFIYLNEFDDGGVRKVSIWESEDAKSLCVTGSGTEQKPSFSMKVANNTPVAINPGSLKSYREGMGVAIGQFAASQTAAFKKLVSAASSEWDVRRCIDNERNAQRAADVFNTSNCRLLVPGKRTIKYWDPAQNREVTREEPEWYNTWTQISEKTSYTGEVTERDQTCFNPLNSKPTEGTFMPPCPPDIAEALGDAKTGTFKTFDGDGGPLQFLCKNPQGTEGSLMFLPVAKPVSGTDGAAYLTRSIAAAVSNGGGNDPGCDKTSVAKMFSRNQAEEDALKLIDATFDDETVYVSSRRVILETFSSLIREASHNDNGGNNRCSAFKALTNTELQNWNFNTSCSQQGPQHAICWNNWALQNMGTRVSDNGGDIVAAEGSGSNWLSPESAALCPNTSLSQPPTTGEVTACKAEFISGTKVDRLTRLMNMAIDPTKMRPTEALLCSSGGENTDVINAFKAISSASCLPELGIDFRCDGGKDCTEVLRCWGTEDGSCVDADGVFIGRIPGRFEQTTLRAGTAGAFNMSSLTNESWSRWSQNGELICKAARGFKIQALVKAEAPFTFDGGLSSTETVSCKNQKGESVGENGDAKESCGDDCGPNKMQVKFTKQ